MLRARELCCLRLNVTTLADSPLDSYRIRPYNAVVHLINVLILNDQYAVSKFYMNSKENALYYTFKL